MAALASFQLAGLPMRMARGDGLGVFDDVVVDRSARSRRPGSRASAGRLRGFAELVEFAIALPVGGDVAGVADGQDVEVGRVAEDIDDLEGGGLLALDAEGIDGIDDGDGLGLADLADEPQGIVEIAVDGDDVGAVHEGLGELAHRDFAGGQQDDAGDAGARGVGGGGGGGVAGGSADDRLGAVLDRLRYGHGHAAILE